MATVREHNGVKYIEHSQTPIPIAATVSHNGRELKFSGKCSIVETQGSWKYGAELHITVHCNPSDVVHRTANSTPWSRIEIAFPVHMGAQLLQRGLNSLYAGTPEKKEPEPVTKLHELL